MKRIILPLLIISLCGCPASPNKIRVENGNESSMNCQQLGIEMQAAQQAKADAHADDKFRFSNIIPSTGIASVYNIWRADSNATNRMEFLNKLAKEKGCM